MLKVEKFPKTLKIIFQTKYDLIHDFWKYILLYLWILHTLADLKGFFVVADTRAANIMFLEQSIQKRLHSFSIKQSENKIRYSGCNIVAN